MLRLAGLGRLDPEGTARQSSGQASVCEGCLKPRQQLPALGQSMGDQGCKQMCLGVTGLLPGAITQVSTPDLGHKKSPMRCAGPGDGDNPIVHALVNTRSGGCHAADTMLALNGCPNTSSHKKSRPFRAAALPVGIWRLLAVGETGFEPAASCSQSKRATKLRHSPDASED